MPLIIRGLGAVACILSVLWLATIATNTDIAIQPLKVVLACYDSVLSTLLGWAEPLAQKQLDAFQLQLYPYWRHFFVLIAAFCFNEIFYSDSYLEPSALISSIGAIIIVFLTSIAVGTIPLADSGIRSTFLVVFIPIFGTIIYYLWNDVSVFLSSMFLPQSVVTRAFLNALVRTVGGAVLLALALQIPTVQDLPKPSLAIFAALVLTLAVYDLQDGLNPKHRNPRLVRDGIILLIILMTVAAALMANGQVQELT